MVNSNSHFFPTLLLAVLIFNPHSAMAAGKVELLKKTVQDACKKEIPEDQLMDAVISAFDCIPKSDVKISDCTIKCLKENRGTVVGK